MLLPCNRLFFGNRGFLFQVIQIIGEEKIGNLGRLVALEDVEPEETKIVTTILTAISKSVLPLAP